jgi:hypothetical protein
VIFSEVRLELKQCRCSGFRGDETCRLVHPSRGALVSNDIVTDSGRTLPTGNVVCEMAMVVARQERHFEPAVCSVLTTNKEPKTEGADRESPHRRFVAAPSADEPRAKDSDQPDATDPEKVVPHRRVSIFNLTFSPEKRVHVRVVPWGFPAHARFGRESSSAKPMPR